MKISPQLYSLLNPTTNIPDSGNYQNQCCSVEVVLLRWRWMDLSMHWVGTEMSI